MNQRQQSKKKDQVILIIKTKHTPCLAPFALKGHLLAASNCVLPWDNGLYSLTVPALRTPRYLA